MPGPDFMKFAGECWSVTLHMWAFYDFMDECQSTTVAVIIWLQYSDWLRSSCHVVDLTDWCCNRSEAESILDMHCMALYTWSLGWYFGSHLDWIAFVVLLFHFISTKKIALVQWRRDSSRWAHPKRCPWCGGRRAWVRRMRSRRLVVGRNSIFSVRKRKGMWSERRNSGQMRWKRWVASRRACLLGLYLFYFLGGEERWCRACMAWMMRMDICVAEKEYVAGRISAV